MSDQNGGNEPSKPRATLSEALKELGRAFRQGYVEAAARRQAEQANATAAPSAPPALSSDEQAKLERLLRAWLGHGREDMPA